MWIGTCTCTAYCISPLSATSKVATFSPSQVATTTTRWECRENAAPKCGDPLGSVWCFILQKCLDLHRFSSSSGFQHHNIRIHNKSHQNQLLDDFGSHNSQRQAAVPSRCRTRDTSRLSGILDNLEGKTRTWLGGLDVLLNCWILDGQLSAEQKQHMA
jgi:hypothetical protein